MAAHKLWPTSVRGESNIPAAKNAHETQNFEKARTIGDNLAFQKEVLIGMFVVDP